MYRPNFCVECGERLTQSRRVAILSRAGGKFCDDCGRRLGKSALIRSLAMLAVIAFASFALGRWLRPAPPPLVIQRAANSPLSDSPVDLNAGARASNRKPDPGKQNSGGEVDAADDTVYLCGARTKKGTPCRRRVHAAGERCYQHKGMPAIVPLDKLVVKSK